MENEMSIAEEMISIKSLLSVWHESDLSEGIAKLEISDARYWILESDIFSTWCNEHGYHPDCADSIERFHEEWVPSHGKHGICNQCGLEAAEITEHDHGDAWTPAADWVVPGTSCCGPSAKLLNADGTPK